MMNIRFDKYIESLGVILKRSELYDEYLPEDLMIYIYRIYNDIYGNNSKISNNLSILIINSADGLDTAFFSMAKITTNIFVVSNNEKLDIHNINNIINTYYSNKSKASIAFEKIKFIKYDKIYTKLINVSILNFGRIGVKKQISRTNIAQIVNDITRYTSSQLVIIVINQYIDDPFLDSLNNVIISGNFKIYTISITNNFRYYR